MKKKIFLLVIMLVAFLSVKEVNAEDYYRKTLKNVNDEISCDYIDGIYSIKDNKEYFNRYHENTGLILNCPDRTTKTIAEVIDGKISDDELLDGENIYLYTFVYAHNFWGWLTTFDGPVISDYSDTIVGVLKEGDILNKGTLFATWSVTVDGKTSSVFYADKDYVVAKVTGSDYHHYYELEPLEDEPEEPSNPEEPAKQEEDYKLDLKCLSDKDGSHHCELYYNGKNNEFEVKFRVQAKNVKGTININNKDLELESNKEYTVNGECSDADCKVLLARFNTKDINRNSSSSMEIEPISLRIDGEEKSINIENSKCEYSKVAENPKTSTYIILVATIIFAVFAGLLIALRKKEVLTKI